MNVLSNTGMATLQSFSSTYSYNIYTKSYQSYTDILNGISIKNSYTGEYCGFNMASIFSSSTGTSNSTAYSSTGTYSNLYSNSYSSSYSNGSSYTANLSGNDGLNRRGALSWNSSSIPTKSSSWLTGNYGSSFIGNMYTSLQTSALGNYSPTSVFEQRLNYHLDYADQKKPGETLGLTKSYLGLTSSSKTSSSYDNAIASSYNVFASSNSDKAGSGTAKDVTAVKSGKVSEMMSLLA